MGTTTEQVIEDTSTPSQAVVDGAEEAETVEAAAEEATPEPEAYAPPSLSDILSSKAAVPSEGEPPKDEPEAEPEGDAEEAESDGEAPSEEELPAAASADVNAEIEKVRRGLTAALADERQKRQALQDEIERLQAQEKPYFDEDAERYHQEQIQKIEQKHQEKFLNMSVALARSQFKDYDDQYKVFAAAVQEEAAKHPEKQSQLLASALAAENPALYAYEWGKDRSFRDQYGKSPDQIRQKIEAELRPKLEEEYKKKFAGKVAARNKQPTSLSKVRAAGGDGAPDWAPTPLNAIFGK